VELDREDPAAIRAAIRAGVANPRPCPLLDVTDAGSPEPAHTAPGADLRTDVPRYGDAVTDDEQAIL
jgi:uncharacterized protein YcsI (UPF0317 family)